MAKVAFVYHPKKTDLARLQAKALYFESLAGWARSEFFETTARSTGAKQARAAVEGGATVVVAVGGDGTVRAVASGLSGTDAALGIIPQGSGNVLCRNIGMPLNDLDAQLSAVFSGKNRLIDLGTVEVTRANGKIERDHFLVLAGIGLDARTIAYTKTELKERFGWLAYVDGGLRTIMKDKPLRIRYRTENRASRADEVYSVMFGNFGMLPGGLLLIPDAKPDDGLLDMIALKPVGPFSWLRIFSILGWENGVLRRSKAGRKVIDLVHDTRYVDYRRVASLALSVETAEPIQLDGDSFGTGVALSCSVEKKAVTVRVLPEWRALDYGS